MRDAPTSPTGESGGAGSRTVNAVGRRKQSGRGRRRNNFERAGGLSMTHAHPLSPNLVRAGCKVMKLDAEKGKPPKFPFLQKKRKDRHNTLEHMRRIGKVSMIQIGDDEFRTPNRRERRGARIRHGQHNTLTLIAAKRGAAALKVPIRPVGLINRACDRRKNAREDRLYGTEKTLITQDTM